MYQVFIIAILGIFVYVLLLPIAYRKVKNYISMTKRKNREMLKKREFVVLSSNIY